MSLAALGRGAKRETPAPASPEATTNRIDYRRGGLTEWYVNGPLGLEQGFTLHKPPEGSSGEALTLALRLGGDLRAATASEGMNLVRADGSTALHYRGLAAWDATGRTLPAWWQGEGAEVRLRVDDAGARYPVTIDPFIQQAKLTASDGLGGDHFGFSVAVSGDTVVVGAPYDDIAGKTSQGSAYVFVKPTTGAWLTSASFAAKLTASDGAANDQLGHYVAVSGNTVVVRSPNDDIGTNVSQGSAYVFVKPAAGWAGTLTESAKLTASDGRQGSGSAFFNFVAVSDDTVVVLLTGDPVPAPPSPYGTPAYYVFVKPAGGWAGTLQEDAKLSRSDGVFTTFGVASPVAIDGDTVAAGPYVYVKPAGGWAGTLAESAKLTASDQALLSGSVSLDADTVVLGAPSDEINGKTNNGSAYIFVKPSGGWAGTLLTERAKLTVPGGSGLGSFVEVSDTRAVVGSEGFFPAYVFVKPAEGWLSTSSFDAKLTSSIYIYFVSGQSAPVAVSGDTVAAGASTDQIGDQYNQGSVYLFGLVPDTTPPDITPWVDCAGSGSGSWCGGTVLVSWFVTDTDSPVTSASGCNPATITSDTPAAGTVFTCAATSAGGTGSESVTVYRDGTPPVVTLMSPGNGASYTVGSTVNATYHCADAGSGVASCDAPVDSGSAIDTGSAGTRGFSVDAEDEAGNTRSVTHTYQLVAHPDLQIIMADTPDPANVGVTLTYSLTITNNGPGAASGVTVADTLPSGVGFGSATRSQGTCSGTSTVTCDLGGLASGASATVSISVTPSIPGTVRNTATVTANEFDPSTANNSDAEDTTVHPQVFCAGVAATMVGTTGDDILVGTSLRDVIAGLGGNDTISALGGNDLVCGGPGNDVITGGNGRDRLLGEDGKDSINGGTDRDTLDGGTGNDKLNGGSDTDRCKGGSGRDTARSCERVSGVP